MEQDDRKVLGDYRIIDEIGAGGMGKVFLAENIHHHKRCALKILPEELSRDHSFRARFFDEARVMSDLNHPNIVRVHHTGEDNGVYYLIMDYICSPNGRPRSIHDELLESPNGRIAPAKAIRWIRQIAEALAYAHSRGVIHRDIKPANVLIDPNGNVRITDFGLVKAIGKEFLLNQIHKTVQQTSVSQAGESVCRKPALRLPGVLHTFELVRTTREDLGDGFSDEDSSAHGSGAGSGSRSLFGTYDYMSPELLEGKDATPQSDIYSLGVMMYRMLTGKRLAGLAKDPSTLVPGLSRKWDTLVAGCLADSQRDRYPTVDALLIDLARITRRSRTPILVAMGMVLLIGVLCLVAWTHLRPPGFGRPSNENAQAAFLPPDPQEGETETSPPPAHAPAEEESRAADTQPPTQMPTNGEVAEGPDELRSPDPGQQRAQALEQSLNDCYMLNEPLPGLLEGMTVKSLYDTWKTTSVPGGGDDANEIGLRVETLTRIQTMSLPAELADAACDPQAHPEAVLAAWRRLGSLADHPWPWGPDQYKQDNDIRSQLLNRLNKMCHEERLLSEDRRRTIQEQIEIIRLRREELALIYEGLQTIRAKDAKDGFLQRVTQLRLPDTTERIVLQDWKDETKALAGFVSRGDWPVAYDLEKFYLPEQKGASFLTKPLEPGDLGAWQSALSLKEYAKSIPAPAVTSELLEIVPGDADYVIAEFRGVQAEERIELKLRRIPAKDLWFRMGVPASRMLPESPDPIERAPVQFLGDFCIGVYEVTQKQYEAVMGANRNPSVFKDDWSRPVENVSWNDANEFCTRLAHMPDLRFLLPDGRECRTDDWSVHLPSEQEWECACRAQDGSLNKPTGEWLSYRDFCGGYGEAGLSKVGWYNQPLSKTKPSGTCEPNRWGLYDMHGNVWEWCRDVYDPALGGRHESKGRVIRGGAYDSRWQECRSAWRDGHYPDSPARNIGFRVVMDKRSIP